jgi:pilus assembly protein CpaE
MPAATASSTRHLLWVNAPRSTVDTDAVIAAARPFSIQVQFAEAGEASSLIHGQRWVAVGVELPPERPEEGVARIRSLHEQFPHLVLFAASTDSSLETMRAALGAGAGDFLSLPLVPNEVHKAFLRLSQTRATATTTSGDIITVFGARGGLGTTTLAVNLAVRTATMTSESVALVDLDLQRGDVAAFLNLTPTQSIAALAHTYSEVDQVFLEGIVTRHPTGVEVLSAPNDIEDADALTRAHIESALGLLRSAYRHIFVDTPRTLTDATIVAFEQANRILVLTDLSIPGLRAGQRSLELLGRLQIDLDRVDVLLTELGKSGISVDDATSALGKRPMMLLPRDVAAACEAMNAGTPLNARDSALGTAIGEIVKKLTGQEEQATGAPLLRRLFGFGRGANR